ncbi:hypothetical protein [Paenibacillus sp. J2TS4]|uniref:hypothetical protein n=1 Tax=Paenibacillus sp. J2TS4 TaxID=2807194 RepID=UPI001B1A5C7F|nr:hypothetical protein [Paenibacillus sp. J2TS4]GIP33436.1 oxidoreductase [Paenibacillus sp. J2TS4]
MPSEHIHVLPYGLGPIGIKIVENCLQTEAVRMISAVDIDPLKIGRDVGELAGREYAGVSVVSNVEEIGSPSGANRKIALHATGSNLEMVWPQIKQLLDHGYSVVSTCEQLAYPWHRYPELSREIDQYASDKQQIVIGTGVNPGFVMDSLALFATSVTQSITRIYISRKVDVAKRRLPLQKKVGIGMTPEQFMELAEQDRIGHVGLEESLRLIAYGLNLSLSDVYNRIDPVISWQDMELSSGSIKKNEVIGLHQISRGIAAGIPIELDLVMSAGAKQEDRLTLETAEMGTLEIVVPHGIFGDTATANIVVNTAKTIHSFERSGLLTMADIPLARNMH